MPICLRQGSFCGLRKGSPSPMVWDTKLVTMMTDFFTEGPRTSVKTQWPIPILLFQNLKVERPWYLVQRDRQNYCVCKKGQENTRNKITVRGDLDWWFRLNSSAWYFCFCCSGLRRDGWVVSAWYLPNLASFSRPNNSGPVNCAFETIIKKKEREWKQNELDFCARVNNVNCTETV